MESGQHTGNSKAGSISTNRNGDMEEDLLFFFILRMTYSTAGLETTLWIMHYQAFLYALTVIVGLLKFIALIRCCLLHLTQHRIVIVVCMAHLKQSWIMCTWKKNVHCAKRYLLHTEVQVHNVVIKSKVYEHTHSFKHVHKTTCLYTCTNISLTFTHARTLRQAVLAFNATFFMLLVPKATVVCSMKYLVPTW